MKQSASSLFFLLIVLTGCASPEVQPVRQQALTHLYRSPDTPAGDDQCNIYPVYPGEIRGDIARFRALEQTQMMRDLEPCEKCDTPYGCSWMDINLASWDSQIYTLDNMNGVSSPTPIPNDLPMLFVGEMKGDFWHLDLHHNEKKELVNDLYLFSNGHLERFIPQAVNGGFGREKQAVVYECYRIDDRNFLSQTRSSYRKISPLALWTFGEDFKLTYKLLDTTVKAGWAKGLGGNYALDSSEAYPWFFVDKETIYVNFFGSNNVDTFTLDGEKKDSFELKPAPLSNGLEDIGPLSSPGMDDFKGHRSDLINQEFFGQFVRWGEDGFARLRFMALAYPPEDLADHLVADPYFGQTQWVLLQALEVFDREGDMVSRTWLRESETHPNNDYPIATLTRNTDGSGRLYFIQQRNKDRRIHINIYQLNPDLITQADTLYLDTLNHTSKTGP